MRTKKYEAVLFDLDGTVVDTAPDLTLTLNKMLSKRGLSPVDSQKVRSVASSGARGLVTKGFGISTATPVYEDLRSEFLSEYEKNLLCSSQLFDGMDDLITTIENKKVPWGIVTNKVHRFTVPLLAGLNLIKRASCIVSGDTTPHAKPHPAPLIEAARIINVAPAKCIYIGDDERDIKAAQGAGMDSVVALYGYLGDGQPPELWNSTYLIRTPGELLDLINI